MGVSYVPEIILTFILISLIALAYLKWIYLYWARRNTPYLPAKLFFGSLLNPFKELKSLGVQFSSIYREIKNKGWKNAGCFSFITPMYVVTEVDLIKNILTKDFAYFEDRGTYVNREQTISPHLIAIDGGAEWKNVRTKMSPAFTTGRLRQVFSILVETSDNLVDAIKNRLLISKVIEVKDLMSSFTIDVIGSSAFGLECKSFTTIQNDFKNYGMQAVQPNRKQNLIDLFCFAFQDTARKLHLTPFSKEVNSFFTNVVKDTVSYRENNKVIRNDFLQQLIDLKNNEDPQRKLSMDCIIAQSFLFFIASYDTSSTTMTFALLELSNELGMQEKARQEVKDVMNRFNGEITYEALAEMKYLGQIVDETLRKHPPAPLLNRRCTKDYQLPNSSTIIEKGTRILIPTLGIHHDAELYPKPDTFDPNRFSEDNKKDIQPGSYLPFGDGPRICLGQRFALMQIKFGLAKLLTNFKFYPHPSTTLPVKLKPSFLMNIDGEVNLNVDKV